MLNRQHLFVGQELKIRSHLRNILAVELKPGVEQRFRIKFSIDPKYSYKDQLFTVFYHKKSQEWRMESHCFTQETCERILSQALAD